MKNWKMAGKFAIALSVNEVLQISNHQKSNDLSVIYYLQIDSHHEKIEAQAFTSWSMSILGIAYTRWVLYKNHILYTATLIIEERAAHKITLQWLISGH